jgi:CubicO group peptidase (beta-lactamase class C family)
MRPPDLLRVGQMVLANGAWQGKQIVPADWLKRSTTPAVTIEGTRRYGWHWYLGELPVGTPRHVEPTISAIGWGGQRLFLVPALDLAVAMNAGNYRLPIMEQGRIGTALITDLVLPGLV